MGQACKGAGRREQMEFCRQHFLSRTTLDMIDDMRDQVTDATDGHGQVTVRSRSGRGQATVRSRVGRSRTSHEF